MWRAARLGQCSGLTPETTASSLAVQRSGQVQKTPSRLRFRPPRQPTRPDRSLVVSLGGASTSSAPCSASTTLTDSRARGKACGYTKTALFAEIRAMSRSRDFDRLFARSQRSWPDPRPGRQPGRRDLGQALRYARLSRVRSDPGRSNRLARPDGDRNVACGWRHLRRPQSMQIEDAEFGHLTGQE